ncbi:MAG TPA: HEAT repeat domain-containing protein [Candidatus Brocadiia bacterium]|nr:HEAT repeat domain-containing protein [Candidatus Brocadiia bacterium]
MSANDYFLNPVVTAAGLALFHSIWQIAAIAVFARLALAILRKHSPGVRYIAACICLLLMVAALPATFLAVGYSRGGFGKSGAWAREATIVPDSESDSASPLDPAIPATSTYVEDSGDAIPVVEQEELSHDSIGIRADAASAPAPSVAGVELSLLERVGGIAGRVDILARRAAPWATCLWLVGVCCLSLRLIAGLHATRSLVGNDTSPASERLIGLAAELGEKLAVARPVSLLQSIRADAPMVVGWLKPVILFPVTALAGMSEDQIAALLAHELAHVRRGDYLVNLLQSVAETLLFYHPAAWRLSARIRAERERCCDDMAVAVCGDVTCYVRALAELAERSAAGIAGAAAVPASIAANSGNLVGRLRRLLGKPEPEGGKALESAAGALSLACVVLLGLGIHACASAPTPAPAPAPMPTAELKSRDWQTRKQAIAAVSEREDAESLIALMAALEDEREEVRREAMDGLKKMTSRQAAPGVKSPMETVAEDNPEATRPLIRGIADEDEAWRKDCAALMKQARSDATAQMLAEELGREPTGSMRRYPINAVYSSILLSWNWVPESPRLLALHIRNINDKDALGRIAETAVPKFAGLLISRNAEDVVLGSNALGSLSYRQQRVNVAERISAADSGIKSDEAVSRLLDLMESGKEQERRAAIEGLRWFKIPESESALKELLKSSNPSDRISAARSLGSMKCSEAIPDIIALLKDPDANVRLNVPGALAISGDERAAEPLVALLDGEFGGHPYHDAIVRLGAPAVKPLMARIEPDNTGRTRTALDILARIGEPAVGPLLDLMRNTESESLKLNIINSLSSNKGPAATAFFIGLARSDKAGDRRIAVSAIGTQKAESGVPALLEVLAGEKEQVVRTACVTALGQIAAKDAVGPLLQVLERDEFYETRGAAAVALGQIGDASAVEPLIARLREETNETARAQAAAALGRLQDRRAVAPLVEALKDDPSPSVRGSAAIALGKIGDFGPLDLMIEASRSGHSEVRTGAMIALAESKTPRAAEVLVEALADDRPCRLPISSGFPKNVDFVYKSGDSTSSTGTTIGNRTHTTWALATDLLIYMKSAALAPSRAALGHSNPVVRKRILGVLVYAEGPYRYPETAMEALKDPDSSVRANAVMVMKHGVSSEAIPPILAALKDKSPEVRIAGLSAMEWRGSRENLKIILAMLEDESQEARRKAADSFGFMCRSLTYKQPNRPAPPLIVLEKPDLDLFLKRLSDPDTEVRRRLVGAIPYLEIPDRGALLENAMKDPDSKVKTAASSGLQKIGMGKGAKELVEIAGSGGDDARSAVKSLEGNPEAYREALLGMLRKGKRADREYATNMLNNTGYKPETISDKVQFCVVLNKWNTLSEMGAEAIPVIMERLKDRDENKKQYLVAALAKIKDPQAVRELIGLLGKYSDPIIYAPRGVTDIKGVLDYAARPYLDLWVWHEVENGLAARAAEAAPLLAEAIRKKKSASAREKMFRALGQMGDPGAAAIAGFVNSRNPETRASCVSALRNNRSPTAAGLLMEAVRRQDDPQRVKIVYALGENKDGRIAPVLLELLGDANPDVRAAAAFALRPARNPAAIEPLIERLRKDESEKVRTSICYALGDVKDPRAVESVLSAMKNDPSEKVRAAASSVAGSAGAPQAFDVLIRRLGDPDHRQRNSAALALSKMGDKRAIEPVISAAIADDEWWVHSPDAFERIKKMDLRWSSGELSSGGYSYDYAHALIEFGQPAVDALLKRLSTADPEVRERVINILGIMHLRSKSFYEPEDKIEQRVRNAARSGDEQVRAGAIEAIRLFGIWDDERPK